MAPPTAQAAWQAAEVVGENVARSIRGQPLDEWTHEDKGTLISVGDDAFVGAGAVVLEDVPAGSLAVGAPARSRPLADTQT